MDAKKKHDELNDRIDDLTLRLASQLRSTGTPSAAEREAAMHAAMDAFKAGTGRYPRWLFTNVELAELVVDGCIRLDDERIAGGMGLARELRAAVVAAARLEREMYPRRATPLVIPDNLNPVVSDVWVEPRIGALAYRLRYSWAIPYKEVLDMIAALGPIVEIGAGGGYWAQLLRERGADVLAFDLEPDPTRNWFFTRQWGPVLQAPATIAGEHQDRTLLLIWPPLDEPMAFEALQSYRGDQVVYIGGGQGGVSADDAFHQLLEDEWVVMFEDAKPNWEERTDLVTVYRRRS
jgi:hypothetical protein